MIRNKLSKRLGNALSKIEDAFPKNQPTQFSHIVHADLCNKFVWQQKRKSFENWRKSAPTRRCDRIGGAERDRTADLVIANDALSQLSYSPVPISGCL
jgi:hypothetical protein